jgi:hypothetical protein
MRKNSKVIGLLSLAVLFPNLIVVRPVELTLASSQDDKREEVTREDKQFVEALYVRLSTLLSREQQQYDVPYTKIKIREYQIKEQIEQTVRKREEAERHLKMKNEEASGLRKALNKTRNEEDRTEISKRLEKVESERAVAEDAAKILRTDENKLGDSLRNHRAMHFSEEKDLKEELDRIQKQHTELMYERSYWVADDTHKNYIRFRDNVMKMATRMGLTCRISIRSERNSVETTGATVKYQTIKQRKFGDPPRTAKCLTTCTEEMTPETYYIWTERESGPTSKTDQTFVIANEKFPVTLKESP